MIKGVRHAGIVVSNLDNALYFYRDILKFRVAREMNENGKYIDMLCGLKDANLKTIKMSAGNGSLIELLHFESHPRKLVSRDICDTGYSHIAITVEDLGGEYNRLKKEGIRFNCAPQISPDGKAKVVFCHDPEGNLIELVEEIT